MYKRKEGLTTIELLIVIGIVAILGTIAFLGFRGVLQGQEQRSAIQSIQQTVWQGATAAASRGTTLELVRSGRTFTLEEAENGRILKTFELPDGVTSNWPENEPLVFTPPGRVDSASLEKLPARIQVFTESSVTDLTVSLIGEVKAVKQ